ncbi:MAG: phosphonate metabolism protein/1,5-bisphosphokinase (PRPP-forming) PhnN [Alphaproteobacteria bacterium]|jgi:ribose 1,5-bisphosphokinase|nr:phosphonate metabolism protein/1,5-bisphosphokinase (PRPP-forming) PhnN [Alphaproteobacteria bacterium]
MARSLGALVLVVGPSGVGKDTLIDGARIALENDKRFVFVRRVVTQAGDIELEEHDPLPPQDFAAAEAADRFCLAWDAHNLRYGLPISVDTDIALGKTVVASVSRHVVAEAMAKYPSCAVVLITAEISLRAQRLIARGRESREQVTSRLARESAAVPSGVDPIMIDNSGSLAIGVTAFVMALRAIAAQE